jgi:hypothetical protein
MRFRAARALGRLLERGMRDGEFRRADVRHTAVSIIALIVFYFSVSPMVRLLGHAGRGIVDTRAALQGEVVNPGQAIVTLINPRTISGCAPTSRRATSTASASATS